MNFLLHASIFSNVGSRTLAEFDAAQTAYLAVGG